ncbi:MAG: 30S ribosomal protein S17 [Myxococcales bacterium]|nr:30S ribosomal protein S17 [Myxococcales bacterium]
MAAKKTEKKTEAAAPKAAAPKAAKAAKPAAEKAAPKPRILPTAAPRGRHRTLVGTVRSDKMDKTVVVEVVSLRRDPVYGKYLKSRERYKAHDEKNQFKTGDRVEITEHSPISRDKRWIVSKLVESAKVE